MNSFKINNLRALGAVLGVLVAVPSASAGDLLAIEGASKSSQRMVSFEYVPSEGEVVLEFEYNLPRDARGVSVAKCAKKVPATHIAYCDYREKEQKILVIVYSQQNAPLPSAGLDLGTVSYTAMAKFEGERVTGLITGNEKGIAVASSAHSDGARSPIDNKDLN